MSTQPDTILISGGAGYIGSHVTHALNEAGFTTVVVDSLVKGNRFAAEKASHFRQGDIGDAAFIAAVCDEFKPAAALHFAAFIEVGESVQKPDMYFENNRDKAVVFFKTMASKGVGKVVFSSTAAVYGEPEIVPITEDSPWKPINPYGQSKLEAEMALREIAGVRSATLRYFNVAGGAPEAGLGETHVPETHLLPRLLLPLLDMPAEIQTGLGLKSGFKVFGTDYPTRDGTAVRDYIHVMDLADAHVLALKYLLAGGKTEIFNLGSGEGYSVNEIVAAARKVLSRPDYQPGTAPRRAGDPATLVADSTKARSVLGWAPHRGLEEMLSSAATWHQTETYINTIRQKVS
ncbi:UDP-glucose-4-epimerase GalE [Rhizomicrobium palustre]|uniref:UDP-glucose 4-epimerase n=1 Tax=Rhizomicrobium palustre TaxID=189966 RepID=A0A846N194_9PROT|nr:UDP-glucose 4-epimerase GalE [Rhizomicrobium palustre]NIK89101.1 UDP-glucose-4-epimerase GalE [Rhizomicrobium palustre]